MNNYGGEFWNNRYSADDFIYGIKPNNFFKDSLKKLNPGKILMLGEGEGRNAVFAAAQGWKVDAVDFSETAKEKALRLAKENSVMINYTVSNLKDFKFNPNTYDAVGYIFSHLNPSLRSVVHPGIVNTLKVGGYLILEVFEKAQLGRTSGGPQNLDMLYSIDELKTDFKSMKIILIEKKEIFLDEGEPHKGEAMIVRLIAQKV